MKTSKAFSTISYNTEGFLKATLDRLVNTRKLDFYAFVEHYPEDDETKRHKHLFLVPNGKVDTDQVREELLEVDLSEPLKPLGCMPCKSSKFADWYLYSLHDAGYLASKGQTRRYHYQKGDFVVSDADYFNEEIHTIDHTKYNRFNELKRAIDEGRSFADVLASGIVPLQQTYAWEKAFSILHDNTTHRGDRVGHQDPPTIDQATGEVLEELPDNLQTVEVEEPLPW